MFGGYFEDFSNGMAGICDGHLDRRRIIKTDLIVYFSAKMPE